MNQENELGWLDLVLYFGGLAARDPQKWEAPETQRPVTDPPPRELRRVKRVEKILQMFRQNEELWHRCQHASTMIATWFNCLPKKHQACFDPVLQKTISQFDFLNPEEKDEHPADELNAFMHKYGTQPEYIFHYSGDHAAGLVLHIPDNGDLMTTLIWAPWFDFSTSEFRPVHMCEWCGVPFYPARSDAKFHNQNCRSAARRSHQNSELR